MSGFGRGLLLVGLLLVTGRHGLPAENKRDLANLERSFWLHASLAAKTQKGYWKPDSPSSPPPSQEQIQNAAALLTDNYSANRLYLLYHHEIPVQEAEQVFRWWRQHCPGHVQLVPTVVLRMYDKEQTRVFTADELRRLVKFFKGTVNATQLAVYDVYPARDQGESLGVLTEEYPEGLIRVGIQPEEKIELPFRAVVQDTWSGFCHGKTHADWRDPGFGRETLQKWVEIRNLEDHPVAWDLIVVAWDYAATERGGYPGYDDASKNMPLPAGRNRLASELILGTARVESLGGFSSDLFILQANSQDPAHDGFQASFYDTLKRRQAYEGYYAVPFQEIVAIYRSLQDGKRPISR
ncbi:MAG: hypothetical protein ACYC0X_02295 [Pirellulaceae bacterium]